jgi:hypothetical protein
MRGSGDEASEPTGQGQEIQQLPAPFQSCDDEKDTSAMDAVLSCQHLVDVNDITLDVAPDGMLAWALTCRRFRAGQLATGKRLRTNGKSLLEASLETFRWYCEMRIMASKEDWWTSEAPTRVTRTIGRAPRTAP